MGQSCFTWGSMVSGLPSDGNPRLVKFIARNVIQSIKYFIFEDKGCVIWRRLYRGEDSGFGIVLYSLPLEHLCGDVQLWNVLVRIKVLKWSLPPHCMSLFLGGGGKWLPICDLRLRFYVCLWFLNPNWGCNMRKREGSMNQVPPGVPPMQYTGQPWCLKRNSAAGQCWTLFKKLRWN